MALLGAIIPLLLAAAAAQDIPEREDIYEALKKLRQELEIWRDEIVKPPVQLGSPTLNFDEIFRGYDYRLERITAHVNLLKVQLPAYLDFLTCKVSFLLMEENQGRLTCEYIPPFDVADSAIVYDDSTAVKMMGTGAWPDAFADILGQRFQLYRTLALPEAFRPAWQSDATSITLYLHGRDLDSLSYSSRDSWLNTLYHLASGMRVYAGPTAVTLGAETLGLQFYILLTTAGAVGHHFLLIDERFDRQGGQLQTRNMVVHFWPFVRTNNLLSLFGTHAGKKSENAVPIEIDMK